MRLKFLLLFIFFQGHFINLNAQVYEEWHRVSPVILNPIAVAWPAKICLDTSLNVITTYNNDFYDAMFTAADSSKIGIAKYTNNGTLLWEHYFGFTGDSSSFINSHITDENNNIYGAGYAYYNGKNQALTFKYDPAGNLAWFDTTGNAYNTQAKQLFVDNGGNLVVFTQLTYSSTSKIGILKYNSSGMLLTKKILDSLSTTGYYYGEVTKDSLDNFYIGTTSNYSLNIIKIDPAFNILFNKSQCPAFQTKSIAIDNLLNIYLAGNSITAKYITAKLNPIGDTIWTRQYMDVGSTGQDLFDMAVDTLGNIYITGNSNSATTYQDVNAVKYDLNGNQVWDYVYDSTGNDDFTFVTHIDKDANVYLLGTNHMTNESIALFKLNPINGNLIWLAVYFNGSTNHAKDFVLDDLRRIYVAGADVDSGALRAITIKYFQEFSTLDLNESDHDFKCLLYPNPCTETVTFLTDFEQSFSVKFYNTASQVKMNFNTKNLNPVNISTLSPGLYIFEISANGNTYWGKIIKQ